MPLLTHEDFIGPVTIAQIDSAPVFELLKIFIDHKEPEVMTDLFGVDGYKKLILMDKSTLSSVQMQFGSSSNDGIFYANSISQLAKISQHTDNIYIEDLTSPLLAKASEITSNHPSLTKLLTDSAITGSSSVWMAFDAFDQSGDLGSVYVNAQNEIKLSDPSIWNLTNNTIDDLFNEATVRSAKIKSFGFYVDQNAGPQTLRSLLFDGDLFLFANAEIVKSILRTAKKIASHFVWYWYSRHKQTLSTSSGEMRQKSENAEPAGQADKQMMIWNEMSRMIRDLHLRHNVCRYSNKYAPINDLNF